MLKIRKAIRAILLILKNPWLLNKVINDDTVWASFLCKEYGIKHGLPLVDIQTIDPGFSETVENFSFLDGGSLPTDIALLKNLCRRFASCSCFEIGTWRGESAVNMADVAEVCYTLNLSEKEMKESGLNRKYIDQYAFFSKGRENIVHLKGNSLTYDFESLGRKFDLIFIDGDHHFESVRNDTHKVFKHLVHEKSIVVWHDYAYNPEKYRPEVLAAILAAIPSEFRKNLYHVSNTMCALFIRENFTVSTLIPPTSPNKAFKIELNTTTIQ